MKRLSIRFVRIIWRFENFETSNYLQLSPCGTLYPKFKYRLSNSERSKFFRSLSGINPGRLCPTTLTGTPKISFKQQSPSFLYRFSNTYESWVLTLPSTTSLIEDALHFIWTTCMLAILNFRQPHKQNVHWTLWSISQKVRNRLWEFHISFKGHSSLLRNASSVWLESLSNTYWHDFDVYTRS